MARTFTSNITLGVTLSPGGVTDSSTGQVTSDDDVRIVWTGVAISNAAGTATAAILGDLTDGNPNWTIVNYGSVQGTGSIAYYDDGIELFGTSASTVVNKAGGVVIGYGSGVFLTPSGAVDNYGTIISTQNSFRGYGYVRADYAASVPATVTAWDGGVVIGGGVINNAASAVIQGVYQGVALNDPGTLHNLGTIEASSSDRSAGALLDGAGVVVNQSATASIVSQTWGLLDIGGAGTLTNYGLVAGQTGSGVYWYGGGTVTNMAGGTIFGGWKGIGSQRGGVITNAENGTIEGGTYGIDVSGGAGTLTNYGQVTGTSGLGAYLKDGGTVTNMAGGTIAGYSKGIASESGGVITNAENGTIEGNTYGIRVSGGPGTVTNQGAIAGLDTTVVHYYYRNAAKTNAGPGPFAGVELAGGGAVTNLAGGTIRGPIYGVAILSAGGTVINSGSISNNIMRPGYLFTIASSSVYGELPSSGVELTDGGSVTNNSGGRIDGFVYGVRVANASGTVVNQGTIVAYQDGNGASIQLADGGVAVNGPNGLVSGTWMGIEVGTGGTLGAAANPTTIINQGSISAVSTVVSTNGTYYDGADIWVRGVATIDNSGIVDGGPYGIVFYDQTTVVNTGSIIAATKDATAAIEEGNTGLASAGVSLRLEEAPTAVISGQVIAPAANMASNVLELLSGSSAGTISGFGAMYQNFGEIVLDPGAIWTFGGTVIASQTIAFAGSNSAGVLTLADPAAIAGDIEGFGPHETLVLSGITDATGVSVVSGGTLEVFQRSGPTLNLQFDPTQTAMGTFVETAVAGATDIGMAVLAPTISGAISSQTVIASGAIPLFSDVTVSDSNIGQIETVTVTPSSGTNGTFDPTSLGIGSYNAIIGVYTVTGSAAAVTTALDGLVFDPSVAGDTSFTITDTDTAGQTASDSTTSVIAASGPQVVDGGSGSYVFTDYPISAASQTIAQYSGSGGTGTLQSLTVDNTNGSSYQFAYNPSSDVSQTVAEYSSFDSSNGAPMGELLSDEVNYKDGETMAHAYFYPTGTINAVTETSEMWSATNPANGAPAGTPISDVVDYSDGTVLVYAYQNSIDPLPSGVAQTTTKWSATSSDGSPSSTAYKISAVVDNSDGTAIVYAYQNSGNTVLPVGDTQTATYYSGYDPSNGAPIGNATSITTDYTAGLYAYQSSITAYDASGDPTSTTDYTGLDASGSVVSSTTYALPPITTNSISESGTISIAGTGQDVDPDFGSNTIQFLSGDSDDTLVLHTGGTDIISGFDPSAGDLLDLRSLFSESGIDLATAVANLSAYINVVAAGSDATVLFDPTGQGGGSAVATLTDAASLVPALKAGSAFVV